MKMTAAQLAAVIGGEVEGNPNVEVSNYAKIEEAGVGDLTFLANPKYTHFIYNTNASVVLVKKDFSPVEPVGATMIRVDDPYATLAELLKMVAAATAPQKQGIEQPSVVAEDVKLDDSVYVGSFSYIAKGAKIGKNVKIYPQCYVGDNVVVGDNTILYPGVKIYHGCVIGRNCIFHSGVVIGGDGFGFAPENGRYEKIAQIGNVVVEDNVEIGANTTIDRATMGSTLIRQGVKLDNLIQVAHNVEIGEHTVMAAQVGVAGSTKIGRHNMIGGQVGFAGHITVGDNNQIGAQSGIPNNVDNGNRLMGYPAVKASEFARQTVYVKKLADLFKEVNELRKKIEETNK